MSGMKDDVINDLLSSCGIFQLLWRHLVVRELQREWLYISWQIKPILESAKRAHAIYRFYTELLLRFIKNNDLFIQICRNVGPYENLLNQMHIYGRLLWYLSL